MNNIATPHPRCTLTLLPDGRVICRSTSEVDGQIAGTSRVLWPGDAHGFRGLSYDTLKEFLAGRPEHHAIANIEDGRIQLADD